MQRLKKHLYLCRMKVSIIVPIYGVEQYIGEFAASLFSQTYQDLEYIFVDDCTPDGSVARLQQELLRHPSRHGQVHIVRNETNRGLGATRQAGLNAATGDFVVYADSDDVLTTDAVELLVKAQEATGADIVDGGYCRLLPDGATGDTVLPFHGTKEAMLSLMLAQNTIAHHVWGRLIRRSLHTDHNVCFVEGINMAEDYCIMPRLLFFATRTYIDNVIYKYRVNTTGTFFGWLNTSNIGSYLGANRVVCAFMRDHDRRHDYTFAVELGMLNAIHRALGLTTMGEIRRHCPYSPTLPLFRLCRLLLCHRATRPLLRAAYLVIKRIYVRSLQASQCQ